MALHKSLALNSGVSVEYWRISKINFDWIANVGEIEVLLYKDEATRNAVDGVPLMARRYPIDQTQFTASFVADAPPRTQAYVFLKTTQAELSGATDV